MNDLKTTRQRLTITYFFCVCCFLILIYFFLLCSNTLPIPFEPVYTRISWAPAKLTQHLVVAAENVQNLNERFRFCLGEVSITRVVQPSPLGVNIKTNKKRISNHSFRSFFPPSKESKRSFPLFFSREWDTIVRRTWVLGSKTSFTLNNNKRKSLLLVSFICPQRGWRRSNLSWRCCALQTTKQHDSYFARKKPHFFF